jgi:hypothetical protein
MAKDWRKIHDYIDHLRNMDKRAYARHWLRYTLDKENVFPPNEKKYGLASMTAQDVRLKLNRLITDNR